MNISIPRLISSILLYQLAYLLMTLSVNADDGRLMDQYPPNVKAENFELSDINGKQHKLSMFKGRYVLVNFWAMSCNVCKSEMTTLQSAYELINSDNFIVISIHAGNKYEGMDSVVKINKITFPVLIDSNLELGAWGVPILPTTFIVSPEGNILYRAVGTRVWNSPFMIDFLQSLIEEKELTVSHLN